MRQTFGEQPHSLSRDPSSMHFSDDSIGQPDAILVGTFSSTWGAFDSRTAALAYCLEIARAQNQLIWITADDPFFDPAYLPIFNELGMTHALSQDEDFDNPELEYQYQITDYNEDFYTY